MAVAAGRSLDLSLFISLPDCSCNALPGLDQRSFKFSQHWQPSGKTDIRKPIKHGRRRHWRHWIVASNGGLAEIEFVDTSSRPTCSNIMSDSFVCDRRNVKANAGRSKAKKGGDSGGRIEGKRNKQGQSPDSIAKTISKGEKQASPKKANLSVEKAGMFESVGIRQPDDYYKYGPYGPHAWKGIVVGKPIPGTFVDQIVVMFSTVKDVEEHEKIAKYDACVSYTERLKHLDANVGIKYFYVFVRASHRLGWQAPWKEWTLVAQVAVESAEDLDKLRLGRRLDKKAMSAVTQCAAWFRPDLIYVKKPKYQVRFEPQEEFILGLLELLDPEKETKKVSNYIGSKNALRSETYYGRLCDVLGVSENTNEKAIVEAFENMDDEGKSSCVEHILCSHPIQLLHPIRRMWNTREKQTIKGDSATHEGGITVVVQNNQQEGEGEGEGESESENENDSMCSEVDENDFMKEDMMPLFDGKNQFDYESNVDNEHVSSAEQDFSGEDYNGEQWETYGDYSNMADESDGEGWENEPSVLKETDEDEEKINGNNIRKAVDPGYGKTENFRVQGQTNPSFRKKKKTQREDNMEDDIEESVFDGDTFCDRGDAKNTEGQSTGYLKSAIRPFTYLNMLKEIILIRRNFVAYR